MTEKWGLSSDFITAKYQAFKKIEINLNWLFLVKIEMRTSKRSKKLGNQMTKKGTRQSVFGLKQACRGRRKTAKRNDKNQAKISGNRWNSAFQAKNSRDVPLTHRCDRLNFVSLIYCSTHGRNIFCTFSALVASLALKSCLLSFNVFI